MLRSLLTILLAAWAGGCVEAPRPQAARPSEPPQAPAKAQRPAAREARAVTSLAEIAGDWDIVAFDGHSPPRLDTDGQRHAFVDITGQGLSFAISCNYSGMRGRITGGVLHATPGDQGTQTAMGCGPEREARDAAFFDFFRSRPQVSLLSDGRLRMAAPGNELLLERSSVRRLATGPALSEITGTWRVVSFTKFEGGGQQGWGAMFAPGRLRIAEGAVSYSRCPAASVRFTYTADFLLRREDGGRPAGRVDCRGVVPGPTEVEPMLAALLGQSPEVERVAGGRFLLRSRDYAVLLASEADYQREFGEQSAEWERRPG